jgi:hypothetical protein
MYVEVLSQSEDDGLNLSGEFSCGRKDEGLSFTLCRIDRL